MTYYDYLCRLLEPMRVYRTERGTLSGGELYAAGAVLDEADGAMEYAEQEGLLQILPELNRYDRDVRIHKGQFQQAQEVWQRLVGAIER